jgi:hypothetical protein
MPGAKVCGAGRGGKGLRRRRGGKRSPELAGGARCGLPLRGRPSRGGAAARRDRAPRRARRRSPQRQRHDREADRRVIAGRSIVRLAAASGGRTAAGAVRRDLERRDGLCARGHVLLPRGVRSTVGCPHGGPSAPRRIRARFQVGAIRVRTVTVQRGRALAARGDLAGPRLSWRGRACRGCSAFSPGGTSAARSLRFSAVRNERLSERDHCGAAGRTRRLARSRHVLDACPGW